MADENEIIDGTKGQPKRSPDSKEVRVSIGAARGDDGSFCVLFCLETQNQTISIPLTADGAVELATRFVTAADALRQIQRQRKAGNN